MASNGTCWTSTQSPDVIDWAAGLYEGEGSITSKKSLVIPSTDLDVLELFQQVVDCGTIHNSDQRREKTCYQWALYRRSDVERIAGELAPYLGERRRLDLANRTGIILPPSLEKTPAWAAGLFEGEGCVLYGSTPRSPKNVFIRAKLGMTDKDVVESFQKLLGFGNVFKSVYKNPKYKDNYTWQCSGSDVFTLHGVISDYLCTRRGEKFEECMKARVRYEMSSRDPRIRRNK